MVACRRFLAFALLAGLVCTTGCRLFDKESKSPDNPFAPNVSKQNTNIFGLPEQEVEKPNAWQRMTSSLPFGKKKKTVGSGEDSLSLSRPSTTESKYHIDVLLGNRALSEGNFALAESKYGSVLNDRPEHLGAILGMAHLAEATNDLSNAELFYFQALDKHPKDPTAYNDLAMMYAQNGEVEEAIKTLSEAVSLSPERKLYRNNLAALYVMSGNKEAAFEQLQAVHSPAVAHYNLGFLLQQEKQTEEAFEEFVTASKLDPALKESQVWIARIAAPIDPHDGGEVQMAGGEAPVQSPLTITDPELETAARPRPRQ